MKGFLRLATEDDADLLFEWANEPAVRKNSFLGNEILYGEHIKWFAQMLKEPDCQQYIYEYAGEPTGQIRLRIQGDSAEISYSICASKRGRGHGKRLLMLICEKVKQDFPWIHKLTGQVKPDNIASQMAFQNAGFTEKAYFYELLLREFIN